MIWKRFRPKRRSKVQFSGKIRDQDSLQLATLAFSGWRSIGPTKEVFGLTYFGLRREIDHGLLLQVLADSFTEFNMLPAALSINFMHSGGVEMDENWIQYHELMFLSSLWTWGIAKRKDGSRTTLLGDFQNPELFKIDVQAFDEIIAPYLDHYGGPREAMECAMCFLGFNAGALYPRDPDTLEGAEFVHFSDFEELDEFEQWLENDVNTLDPEYFK